MRGGEREFFSVLSTPDDDVLVHLGVSRKKENFSSSRSLALGPLYPFRHGPDGAPLSSQASELDTRGKKGEGERERGEKKLAATASKGKKDVSSPKGFGALRASLSSPCLSQSTTDTEGGARWSCGAGERRRRGVRRGRHREALCDALALFGLKRRSERRKVRGDNDVDDEERGKKHLRSPAQKTKHRKARDRETRSLLHLFSCFRRTHEDKCPLVPQWGA